MLGKRSLGERIFDLLNGLFMTVLMVVCAYPFLYVLFASLSDPRRLMRHQGALLGPLGFTLRGYELVLKNPSIAAGYGNTIIYLVAGTALNLLMTSLGAYVLSRKKVKLRIPLMFMITFTMFFGGGLIPFYILVQKLGMLNTRWALIIPGAIGTWNLIIMRTSIMSIPDSLEESAKIDGANDFTVLFRIILPLSQAVLAVMTLFYAVGHWNAWFNAMIFIRNRELFPLQLILREILISNDVSKMTQIADVNPQEENMYRALVQYCTVIVATAPILCIYPFLQKYFVKGVMIGSLKE